ncbi:hypothetical protein GJ496_002722, partial [Pomphorhynchus laevis]
IEQFFNEFKECDIPRIQSIGASMRERQLLDQIPDQDMDMNKFSIPLKSSEFSNFFNYKSRMLSKFGVGQVTKLTAKQKCEDCQSSIFESKHCVKVSIGTQTLFWHPDCFRCRKCKNVLVDYAYCHIGFNLYCIRHFNDITSHRCYDCDEYQIIH